MLLRQYGRCTQAMTHDVAGEFLSRARPRRSGRTATAHADLARTGTPRVGYLFAPLVLERLADRSTETEQRESTMSLADLFTWTQASIYGSREYRTTREPSRGTN